MTVRETPVHEVHIEYVDTTPEFLKSFVDDLAGNPLGFVNGEEHVRYAYLRERGPRMKVMVVVTDRRGFNQRRALLHVYQFVRGTYRITDGLRDNLDRDIDELLTQLGE